MTLKTAREVRADAPAALTRSQPGLPAAALAATPGRVFSRDERTADVHGQNLRARLGDDPEAPRWTVTVAGAGRKPGGGPDD